MILPDDHEKYLELRSELINIFVIIKTLVFTFHTGHAFLITEVLNGKWTYRSLTRRKAILD